MLGEVEQCLRPYLFVVGCSYTLELIEYIMMACLQEERKHNAWNRTCNLECMVNERIKMKIGQLRFADDVAMLHVEIDNLITS